jgi:uncharacterized protein
MTEPLDVLQAFLAEAFDPDKIADVAHRLVAEDATYVSLNFADDELARLMPWAGTKHGRQGFIDNFSGVSTRWTNTAFDITDRLSSPNSAAVFGSFTLVSTKLGRSVTSPFAVLAHVQDGRITYFQYMEDTFATARSFRSGGTWTIEADPRGEVLQV